MKTLRNLTACFALLMLATLLMQSCATTRPARKCNGQKAIRTPMGPM
ncbi:MAG: hypothetical protein K9J06_05800 [Flavobacteriales bacterium]|nr:hypothetical protein [Flavobacteriales bacterium]